MIRTIFICLFLALLCVAFGCNRQNNVSMSEQVEPATDLKQDSFPAFLVGVWEPVGTREVRWKFKFEKDGTISAMRNFWDAYIEVSEGGAYEKGPDDMEAVCILGPVDVDYDPDSRILTVKVVTDYFMLHINDEMMEGSSVDTLTGPVSADGRVWDANWISVSRMLDGPPMDFNNPSINPVIFHKIEKSSRPPEEAR